MSGGSRGNGKTRKEREPALCKLFVSENMTVFGFVGLSEFVSGMHGGQATSRKRIIKVKVGETAAL